MAYNIMNEYSKITIKQLNEYMKLILENKYNKAICDEFTNVYMNIRYNGLIENKVGLTVRNKLLAELKNKKDQLLEDNPDKDKNINYTYLFFDDCAYFDTAEIEENLDDKVEEIVRNRREYLQREDENDTGSFKEILKKTIKENIIEKDNFLKKFDTNEFNIKVTNYQDNLQKIRINYNIKFPMLYSNEAINKAFDVGTIAEDKLFVEYYLTAVKVIREIENSEYRKSYIVDIDEKLFEKEQKLARLLEIINNPTLQDRIIIEISYNTLKEKREKIYDLVSRGYQFAINISNDFEADDMEIQRLTLFRYILTNRDTDESSKFNNLVITK